MSGRANDDGTAGRVVRVSVDMPEALRFRLKHAALEKRTTLRQYVLQALRERLEETNGKG